jgi:molecular chaperone GrpE
MGEQMDPTPDILEIKEDLQEPAQDGEEQGKENDTDAKLSLLENELAALKEEKDKIYNQMLRTQADFENFKRRTRQEYEQMSIYAGEELVKKILPVLDSLERAVACFDAATENAPKWQEGVELTLRQFQSILKTDGLEEVLALNELFDPQYHEAMLQEESDQVEHPTVIEELQKGYKYKDRLIRPALVKVAVPKQ